jgi:hypothetical protein
MIRHYLHYVLLLTAGLLCASTLQGNISTDSSVDDLFNPETNLPSPVPAVPGETDCLSASAILALITPSNDPDAAPPLINVPRILQENLYRHTTGPVTRRSLLDQPALKPDWLAIDCWSWTGQLFYNYTPHVFFTENSPFIRDYLDLTNENIVSELSEVIERLEITKANIPEILGFFSTIKLQQHRAGLMLGLSKVFQHWAFDVRIPVYYLLEHFFLTKAEIERIENSTFVQELQPTGKGPSGCDENEAKIRNFVLQHLVSDRVGFGDTRLSLNCYAYESKRSNLWLGLRTTIPTAVTFRSALLGGEFARCSDVPPFDIFHLFNVALCMGNTPVEKTLANIELQNLVTDFLVGALDRLSNILIETPLGNGGHFGAGPELTFRYQFNDYFSMHTYAAVEGFAKHKERRFFLVAKNPEDFNRDWRNESMATQNLSFLNQQVINTLFPLGVSIEVKPGLIAQISHSFRYDTQHWHASLGFDYWRQGAEKFGALLTPTDMPLVLRKGLRPAAQQGKIFGSFGYYGYPLNHCFGWHILGNVDASVFNKGIGENFTISILLGMDF